MSSIQQAHTFVRRYAIGGLISALLDDVHSCRKQNVGAFDYIGRCLLSPSANLTLYMIDGHNEMRLLVHMIFLSEFT